MGTSTPESARVEIMLTEAEHRCLMEHTAVTSPPYAVLEATSELSGSINTPEQRVVHCHDEEALALLAVAEQHCPGAVAAITVALAQPTCPQCGRVAEPRRVGRRQSWFGTPGSTPPDRTPMLRPAHCEHCGWEGPKG